MSRFTKLGSVLLVALVASIAYGGAVKITEFQFNRTIAFNGDAMAILNHTQGTDKTVVQLIVKGLPIFPIGGAFECVLSSPSHANPHVIFFTADVHGASTIHESVDGDWSDSDITLEDDGDVIASGTNPG